MKYIADATWVIDFLAGHSAAVTLHPTLVREGLTVSVITFTELWEGVLYTKHDRRTVERSLRTFLRPVTILPYSRSVAQRVAQLRGEMRGRGLQLQHRALDLLIAGTALHYGLTMVSSDADFNDIPGLTLLNPRTGALQKNTV